MKYRFSHYPGSWQPMQVEEDVWEETWDPEFWVVTMTKETSDDDVLMKKIYDYYTSRAIHAVSNMVYFETEKQVTFFKLMWLK